MNLDCYRKTKHHKVNLKTMMWSASCAVKKPATKVGCGMTTTTYLISVFQVEPILPSTMVKDVT